MADGVMIFQGMKVGFLPGDLKLSINDAGETTSKLILSTAYNVLPLWLRIAHDNLIKARKASDDIKTSWGESAEINKKELLILELAPSLQVFVSCGIAFDALYDQLRPYAKFTTSEIEKLRASKTGRAAQISDVIRRVYKLNNKYVKEFRTIIGQIIKYRDLAVHPSLELRNALSRPDISVGVDWKFSVYQYSNCKQCFKSTMDILIYLYEKKCKEKIVVDEMEGVFKALEELKVVTLNNSNFSA